MSWMVQPSFLSTKCVSIQQQETRWQHPQQRRHLKHLFSTDEQQEEATTNSIDFDSLMEMDCVIFSRGNHEIKELGVIEENQLQPICAWTMEEAFDDFIEFVVDEEDRFTLDIQKDNIIIHKLIENDQLSYGSRQVGGGKGPGNPHGEESEILYYIQQDALQDIQVIVKPELEITW